MKKCVIEIYETGKLTAQMWDDDKMTKPPMDIHLLHLESFTADFNLKSSNSEPKLVCTWETTDQPSTESVRVLTGRLRQQLENWTEDKRTTSLIKALNSLARRLNPNWIGR